MQQTDFNMHCLEVDRSRDSRWNFFLLAIFFLWPYANEIFFYLYSHTWLHTFIIISTTGAVWKCSIQWIIWNIWMNYFCPVSSCVKQKKLHCRYQFLSLRVKVFFLSTFNVALARWVNKEIVVNFCLNVIIYLSRE